MPAVWIRQPAHRKNWFFGCAFGRMAGNIQAAMAAVGGKRIPPGKFRHAALSHENRAVLVFLCQTRYGGCIRAEKPHEGFIQPASNCFGRRNRCTTCTATATGWNAGDAAGCAVGKVVWNFVRQNFLKVQYISDFYEVFSLRSVSLQLVSPVFSVVRKCNLLRPYKNFSDGLSYSNKHYSVCQAVFRF